VLLEIKLLRYPDALFLSKPISVVRYRRFRTRSNLETPDASADARKKEGRREEGEDWRGGGGTAGDTWRICGVSRNPAILMPP